MEHLAASACGHIFSSASRPPGHFLLCAGENIVVSFDWPDRSLLWG